MDSEGPPPAAVLAIFDALGRGCEPVSARELADELDCSRRVAAERLDELVERGVVESKSVGDGRRVWWRPADSAALDEARFRSLVDAVDEYAIFMLDPDGHVVTWNEGAERIKGYGEDEVVGEHFSTFYTDEDREAGVPERNLAAAAERGRIEDEGWRVRDTGTRFWANVVLTAIRNDDGALTGFAKVTRDMTERRAREEQLQRERDQTEQLLKTSPVAISVRDADGNVVLTNEQTEDLLELSGRELRDEPTGGAAVDMYDAEGRPLSADELPAAEVVETGDPVFNRELVVEKSDGERRWLSVNATPTFGPDGDLDRIITTGEDVTELKQRQRELETELGEILGRVSDAFYALDEEFRFTLVNERAEELLQHSEEELLGENLWEAFPEAAEEDTVWDSFHTAMETQEPTSYELYFPPLGFRVEANVYPSETGVSVYFRDVTERVERERELAESERRYRTLAENFPNGVVTLYDADCRYTLAAGQAFEYLPVSADDLEGRTPREVFGDDPGERLESALSAALDGEPQSVEAEYAGRRWMIHAVAVTDEEGEAFTGLTMAQDVTERKQREQRLERFASVVSHGLRNPLSIAQIYLTRARNGGDAADFEEVDRALDRMERIIQNLLTTALEGRSTSEREPVSLASAAERAWGNVETGDATLRVDDEAGTVVAEPDQLQTVLESLFRNSAEYGGPAATVDVGRLADVSTSSEGRNPSDRSSGLSPREDEASGDSTDESVGGFYVEDDGPGIPPERRSEVFEYGYTSTSGTGIGLAVVHDVAGAHGWEVAVTDAESGGAHFEFTGVERVDGD